VVVNQIKKKKKQTKPKEHETPWSFFAIKINK
jgi:hypothetical protein